MKELNDLFCINNTFLAVSVRELVLSMLKAQHFTCKLPCMKKAKLVQINYKMVQKWSKVVSI
jgi:hypothetical protein